MTRHIKITMFVLIVLGATSGAVSAEPDAAPAADEIAMDAGAASTAADVVPSAPEPQTKLVNPAEENPIGVARDVYQAFKAGKWIVGLGGIGLIVSWLGLLVIGWRKPAFAEKRWARYAIAFGSQLLVVAGVGLAAGIPPSFELAVGWFGAAMASSGLLELISDAFPGLGKGATS